MKKKYHRIIEKNRRSIARRLRRQSYADQPEPMLKSINIDYQVAARTRAIGCGGIGAIHTMVCRLGLDEALNESLQLLKVHQPYHESDHILHLTYNVMTGGTCLEDLERWRQDEGYLNGLGAQRLPDPTTAGDFLRRFSTAQILELQEAFNRVRLKVWEQQSRRFFDAAIIDVDGTLVETTGQCKGGMDKAYTGIWGYAPLLVTLAQTREVLYVVNRPGNRPSSDQAAPWLERALSLVAGRFKQVWVRGDTDFSLTTELDGWSARGFNFVLGFDAKRGLQERADGLPEEAWERLHRPPHYQVETQRRERPEQVKARIVKEREYRNLRLESEEVAEFRYRPVACAEEYRMVVLRKNLSVEKGEARLFDELRYFFYITNDWGKSAAEVVFFANQRCDQENIVGQLKSGVGALRMPSSDLNSNWAYMVIGALGWNLKAWYGLLVPDKARGREIVRMEFKRFLLSFVRLACQIVQSGRRVVYRVLAYSAELKLFLRSFEYIKGLKLR